MTSAQAGAPCPLCRSASKHIFRTFDRNHRYSEEVFEYRRCGSCNLIFLVDPPDDLGRFYESDYYGTPTLEVVEGAARREHYQIELVLEHVSPGRLVEIGSAFGVFASQARDAGFEVTAVDMDERCCEFLRSTLGVDSRCTDRPDALLGTLPASRVIVLWHVVEHLRDPWSCLAAASENLEPGGVLVLATPNPRALGFRLTGRRWPHVDAPRHLWLIPAPLLTSFLDDRGLTLEALTASDREAEKWNRFSWQRIIENSLPAGERATRVATAAGSAIGSLLAVPERAAMNGSSYTAVFRKPA